MRAMTIERLRDFIRRLPPKYAALVAMGVTTGCRISELLGLRWVEVVDIHGRLRRKIDFMRLKARGDCVMRRRLAIPTDFQPFVMKHFRKMDEKGRAGNEDFVFQGRGGRPLTRMSAYMYFRKHLGAGYGTHWMRKTFARSMYRYYMNVCDGDDALSPVERVRRDLAHARLETTVEYLEINDTVTTSQAQEAVFRMKGDGYDGRQG